MSLILKSELMSKPIFAGVPKLTEYFGKNIGERF